MPKSLSAISSAVLLVGAVALGGCVHSEHPEFATGTYRDLSPDLPFDIVSFSPAGPGQVGPGMYKWTPPERIGGTLPDVPSSRRKSCDP